MLKTYNPRKIVKHKVTYFIRKLTEWSKKNSKREDKEYIKTCELVTRDFKKYDDGDDYAYDCFYAISLHKNMRHKFITISDQSDENYIYLTQEQLQKMFDLLKENKFIKG